MPVLFWLYGNLNSVKKHSVELHKIVWCQHSVDAIFLSVNFVIAIYKSVWYNAKGLCDLYML